MNSHITNDFLKLFRRLPDSIKNSARKSYLVWKDNHYHPSLNFKEIKTGTNIYSVRIGIGWRALGILRDDNIVWFWIGSHAGYDKIIGGF